MSSRAGDAIRGLGLEDLHKSFGEVIALDQVSFDVTEGEIVAVLGPSGCGKSTLLNVIAGLERPDRGRVMWNGESLAGVPTYQREFGLMFQDNVLFPHMSVSENVAFGLRMNRLDRSEIANRVEEVLELVDLQGFGGRDVNVLSGGEEQRVALARALAPQPRLLMLDEPLGSLDRTLRERLMAELGRILRRLQQTAIYVTHDQEEAFALSDRVVLMNAGRVLQIGEPQQIYRRPGSELVARFLGMGNLLKGQVLQIDGDNVAKTAIGLIPVMGFEPGEVTVLLRPDAARVDGEGDFILTGVVTERSFRGGTCRARINVDGEQLSFDFPSHASLPSEGEQIKLSFRVEEAVRLFRR